MAGSGQRLQHGLRRQGDIRKVRVKHGPDKVRLTLRHPSRSSSPDFYDFWVDVDSDDPGPEFRVSVFLEVEKATVTPVTKFGQHHGEETCERDPAKSGRTVKAIFPRSCFETPATLRVSTQTSSEEFWQLDWAPARRKSGPWVDAG